MRTEDLIPRDISPGIAAFLAVVDQVKYDPQLPHPAATSLIKGRLELSLGQSYVEQPEALRKDILHHEAYHFYISTIPRMVAKCGPLQQTEEYRQDMALWNLVTDAAIHYGMPDSELVKSGLVVTWEKLGLVPTNCELAFDLLKERVKEHQAPGGGCGSCQHSRDDGTWESQMKAIGAAAKMGQHEEFSSFARGIQGGEGRGAGAYLEAAPPPAWIRETLDYLVAQCGEDRRRSWRRENRAHGDLPGRSYRRGRSGLFLIDSSASIDDDTLRQFLGAVMSTPELAGSECAIFDSRVTRRAPVRQAKKLLESHGRGGTAFAPPAALRQPGESVVWLTDGYPCDGWPPEHEGPEVWCITTDVRPPHGVRVQAS